MSAKKSQNRPSSFFLGQLKLWAPCAVSPFIHSAGRNEAATPFEFRGRARQMNLKERKWWWHTYICKWLFHHYTARENAFYWIFFATSQRGILAHVINLHIGQIHNKLVHWKEMWNYKMIFISDLSQDLHSNKGEHFYVHSFEKKTPWAKQMLY